MSKSDHASCSPENPTAPRPPAPPPAPPAPDPFDVAALRLPQGFAAATAVKKILTVVPVGRPAKEAFFRVRPGEDFRLQAATLELKADRETYLVAPALLPHLVGESCVAPRLIVTTVTRQGAVALWPLRLPGPDGKFDAWGQSALEAAKRAEGSWVRLTANMGAGMYDVHEATADLPEPEWPAAPFQELIKLAFKDKLIADPDHPVLRQLRGEQ